MSAQLSIFDLIRPRSKAGQLSSQRAERRMRESGALKGQAMQALMMIGENPGLSTKQLGAIGPLDRYQVARRTPELLEAKLVRREQDGDEDFRWFVL